MRLVRSLFVLLPIVVGCGSAQLVLKSPVESKCNSAGLKGCPELTEGVLLYVEGKKDEGKEKITAGAAQNAPAKVKQFAQGLRELKKVPGVADHMKPIMEVADILAASKGGGGAKGRKGIGGAEAEEAAYGDDESTARREGGTVVAASVRGRVSCGNLPGYAQCVLAAPGPLVITDLVVGEGCPAEMIAAAARSADDLRSVRWIVRNPHGLGGERGLVRSGESLFIGVQSSAASDPRCSLTWSGYRPNESGR
ncbi:MAG: hypothetical protein QM820_19170 [Minicystis sp.]